MIGRADGDRIDVVGHLVEQLAPVEILLRIREALGGLLQALRIDIADGDHVAVAAGVARITRSFPLRTDAGKPNPVVRRFLLGGLGPASYPDSDAGQRAGLQKFATV